MLTRIFLSVVLLSVMGSVGYLLLKLASAIGGDHLSENWRYRGGMAVSLLFILPLHKLWPTGLRIQGRQLAMTAIQAVFPATPGEQAAQAITGGTGGGVEAAINWPLVRDWIAVLWLVVMVILALKAVVSFLRCQRMFKRIGAEADNHLYQLALEASKTTGIRGKVRLQVSPLVQSPMLVGYFRSTIMLPSKEIPDNAARLILAHELTHLRRKDQWKKLTLLLIQHVHWFNPVVYLLSRDCLYWMETSCDECIVSSMHRDQRKAYGLILIDYTPNSTPRQRNSKVYVSFAPSRYKLEKRISTMLNSGKKPSTLLSLVLTVVLLISCIATSALAANPSTPGSDSRIPIATSEATEREEVLLSELTSEFNLNDPIGSSISGTDSTFDTNAVDLSKSITVKKVSSWSTSFNTGKFLGDDHNAFKIIVKNVSGSSYEVIVENSNGWIYSTPVYTGDSTTTVTNVSGNDTYTVYILNVGTDTLTADVSISSYYNS